MRYSIEVIKAVNKCCLIKMVNEKTETAGELIENKTADKKVKPKPIEMKNQDIRKKYTFHQNKDKKLLKWIHLKLFNKKMYQSK